MGDEAGKLRALHGATRIVRAQVKGDKLRAEGKPTEAIHVVTKESSRVRDGKP